MPLRVERDSVIKPRSHPFSFASHALESHNDLVLMTQHPSFPSRASVPCIA
ncbi:MAG: hypothetical protein PV344_06830 [Anaplasma sp.]|nr:hypothetical protein [Anaplasma sp.]